MKNEYLATKPIDKSVQFNKENAKKLGELLYHQEADDIEKLQEDNQRLKQELNRIRDELINVYNSKSWRSTEILRKISHKIKNGD